MLSFKKSISRKFILLLFVVLLLTSLLLSISFYFISINTIDSYVMPQINKQLTASAQDVYKSLNATSAQQTLNKNEQARTNVEFYFEEKRKQHNVETIFLIDLREGKATVLTADHVAKLKPEESIQVWPAMEQAAKGKAGLSEIYADSHGVHKTAYVGVPGTTMIVGVSSDVGFVQDKMNSILWTSAGITLLALIIGLSAAAFMSRRITRPITQLAAYSNKLAGGDFTETLTIKGSDEVGQLSESFRIMSERLKEMIGHVLDTSGTVVTDSNDLKERVQVLNTMAEHSASSVEEIGKGSTMIASSALDNSRAMDEINIGIQHIASAAGEVTEQISEASAEAMGGNEIAQSAVQQMRQVEQASIQSMEQFRIMNERSLMIGEVVQGITEITKQIQMLSLNASIEAARAGEHGRGFAVVAGEVRKLSEQSKESNEQIREFLLGLQEDMNHSVSEMNHVNAEVASGMNKVVEAGNAFNHLLILIQSINHSIQSVSAATQQISAGTEEVSASVEETAQITAKSQQSAATLTDNSARQHQELEGHALTVEHLHQQAVKLQKAVGQFKI
ncbi:methyl-accepting chemotaxis protein [Paenibacillus sp. MMS20-IR301]|uniref:methyl-accepting chemotaxis protein n=1 Tax=Paenibacillus sp. MMS20-IR301 TaxID=2895946 RepID=UPI0028E79B8E|nr:methyl-accepting chemotaxis protein [Paenibacillus sp. MMS20-IR301]WNS40981.1 methyl-accepting chemotaxis protein [Paenibacillus sp. MMS20-IR301]